MKPNRGWGAGSPRSSAMSAMRIPPSSGRAGSGGCRLNSCGRIRAIRASISPTANSTSSPPRSRSAASSSRSWCGRCAGPRTPTRSSPASGAGGRRSAPPLHDVPIILHRGRRPRGAGARDHRERAARRPQSARGGGRLPRAGDEFKQGQEEIAKVVGKSRSHVANTLRLLKLPEKVKAYINEGKLSAGHARALLGRDDPEKLAQAIVEQGLSVRQAEALTQDKTKAKARAGRDREEKDADTRALERRMSDALGLVVTIDHRAPGGMSESDTRRWSSSTTSSTGWKKAAIVESPRDVSRETFELKVEIYLLTREKRIARSRAGATRMIVGSLGGCSASGSKLKEESIRPDTLPIHSDAQLCRINSPNAS